MIAALTTERVIGKENALPWRLPADLKHFKALTMGKPIIMGRKTYESIGRPLPGRHNIVVTRNEAYRAPGCTVVHTIEAALAAAGDVSEVMVIGGSHLFEALLPQADRLYLTIIDEKIEGDTYFPPWDEQEWRELSRSPGVRNERNPFHYEFLVLERRDSLQASSRD